MSHATTLSLGHLRLDLPESWAFSTLMFHFEGEELGGSAPFAANVVLQNRIDVPRRGVDLDVLAAGDLAELEARLPGFKLEGRGPVDLQGRKAQHLEFGFDDLAARRLQQLVLYIPTPGGVVTLTGTHVAARFPAVRNDFLLMARSVAAGGG